MQKPPIPPLESETLRLLPAPETHPRCAPFAQGLGLDPGGTAIPAQRLIVVDAPRPWPKPVWGHPQLLHVTPKATGPDGPVRVLASVPRPGEVSRVRTFYRENSATQRVDHVLPDDVTAEAVGSLVDNLTCSASPAEVEGAEEADPTAVLVCTQGSHDVCCGTEGSRLANELDGAPGFQGMDILQVSHTGGHRFAPTAVTFPSGRMWAFVEREQLAQIQNETGSPADVAPFCRGWWGADSPASQMAERAVFASKTWDWERTDRKVVSGTGFDVRAGASGIFSVESNGTRQPVEIRVTRQVPTITCRAAGGLPAKPGWEYTTRLV